LADLIIELAKLGERDPARLGHLAVKRMNELRSSAITAS
jgi:hypothetical protein